MMYHSIYPQISTISPASKNKHNQKQTKLVKFPQDIQVIVRSDRKNYGNLYIGNLQAAENIQLLENLEIGAILSIAKGYQVNHPQKIIRHSCYIPFPDKQDEEMYQEILDSVEFIENCLVLTNVLVHCVSGGNKSGCVAMAYLIKAKKLSSEDAQIEVKNRRKIIQINDSMREKLKKYELDLNNTGFRKSRFNYSMRVDTKRSKSEVSKSYFGSILPKSESSIKTNKNQLIVPGDRGNTRQTTMKSKTYLDQQIPVLSLQKKSKTLNQNPENFQEERENCKTMQFDAMHNMSKKSKTLGRSEYSNSKYSVLNKRIPTVTIEPFNTQGYDMDQFIQPLRLTKKSNSRQQFDKKIKIIDSRNQGINKKLRDIQEHFEKSQQQNKHILEQEMKQIDQMKEQIIKKHQQRRSRIREMAKSFRQHSQINNCSFQHQYCNTELNDSNNYSESMRSNNSRIKQSAFETSFRKKSIKSNNSGLE